MRIRKYLKGGEWAFESDLDDLRFPCKSMAASLSTRKDLRNHRWFPMRDVTDKVREGTVTLYELSQWYPRAVRIARKEA